MCGRGRTFSPFLKMRSAFARLVLRIICCHDTSGSCRSSGQVTLANVAGSHVPYGKVPSHSVADHQGVLAG